MKSVNLIALSAAILASPFSSAARAQLEWRVSVKFILNANGNRWTQQCVGGPNNGMPCTDGQCGPGNDVQCGAGGNCIGDLTTDADIDALIDNCNAIMDVYGRGYRYVLSEPAVDLPGVSQWFNAPIDGTTRADLEAAAEADPVTYAYRTNATNVYILGSAGSGFCSIPGNGDDIIILGQNLASPNTPPHEFGHFFGLCHVQGCPCPGCGAAGESEECMAGPLDDMVTDTLPMQACWDQDDIAMNWFGQPYNALTPAQQQQVDFTYDNLMTNRCARELLTSDQLDRMTDASNGPRNNVATGRTRFVDLNGFPMFQFGSSFFPFVTVVNGLAAADPGDIILVRPGNYDEPMVINQYVFIRATRGNAVVGEP